MENRNDSFSVFDGSLDAFPFPGKLFVEGQFYELNCAYHAEGDQPRYDLKLREQAVELGELKLAGAFIQRVQLSGGPGLVVLDTPTGTVRVPAGRYGDYKVRVDKGGVFAYSVGPRERALRPLVVEKEKATTLTAGGPLTNSVRLTQRGRRLVLDYELLGAGGGTYQLGTTDYNNPPRFAVYQGEKKIASGKFEFG